MRGRRAIDFRKLLEDEESVVEREIRRKEADWSFINSLNPRLMWAVKLFIEKGDLRLAQHMSGLDLEDFIEVLRSARVPVFITVIKEP
ncbi:MAG: hypothetical protein ACP5JF_06345 [Candidatus Methanodesulfokora sp.]|jgi:hypothetical protein